MRVARSRRAIRQSVASGSPLFDLAVVHHDDAVAMLREFGVVGDDEQSRAECCAACENQLDDRLAGCGVEIARRFVGKDDRGRACHRARNGNALLLAARKLCGIVGETVSEPHGFEFGGGTAERIGDAGQF